MANLFYKHDPTRIEEVRHTLEAYVARIIDDTDPDIIYVGFAPIGSLSSEPKWVIRKTYKDGVSGFTIDKYAWDATKQTVFGQIFDDHLTLTYV